MMPFSEILKADQRLGNRQQPDAFSGYGKISKTDIAWSDFSHRSRCDAHYLSPGEYPEARFLAEATAWADNGVIGCPRHNAFVEETLEDWVHPIRRHSAFQLPGMPKHQRLPGITADLRTHGGRTFYHFLFEALPRLQAIESLKDSIDHYLVTANGEEWKKEWLEATGLTKPIVWCKPLSHYFCDQLIFTKRPSRPFEPNPRSVSFIRHRLEFQQKTTGTRRLWMSRKNAHARSVVWERDLEIEASSLGYDIVDPQRYSPKEFIELLSDCAVFAGFHGAAFANLIFLPRDASVLEVYTSEQEPWFPRLAQVCGVTYRKLSISAKKTDQNKVIEFLRTHSAGQSRTRKGRSTQLSQD
ncbi:MAG: glycosyltransferase 61 family protein [Parvularcula sp.]|nr:glycosyltransferase 61 family protein [Parvularcula sp.]